MSDMKTRDFTRETYEILIKEIEKIDSENWSKVTDFIGDIFLRIGKFTHFISLDEEMQNVREFQKSVLDMNNTTKSQLKKIFNQTNTTDHVMAGKIKHVNEQQEPYNQKLKQLCDMIQPNWNIQNAKYIAETCQSYNKKMGEIDKITNQEYKAEAKEAVARQMKTAAKNTISGILGVAVSVMSMPATWIKVLATEGPKRMAIVCFSDTWGLVDKTFQVGGGLVGLAGAAISYGVVKRSKNVSMMEEALKSNDYANVKTLSDVMIASGEDEDSVFVKTAKGLTTSAEAFGIASDVKEMVKSGTGILPSNPIATHKILHKADMLPEAQKNYRHIQWMYNKFEKKANVAKNIKLVYDTGSDLWELNQPDANAKKIITEKVGGQSKLIEDVEKIIGFAKDE